MTRTQQTIKFSVDLTPEHFVEAWERAVKSKKSPVATMIVVTMTAAFVVFLLHNLVSTIPHLARVPPFLSMLVEGFLAIVGTSLLLSFRLFRDWKRTGAILLGRMTAAQHEQQGLHSVQWTFSDEGVIKTLGDKPRSYEWGQVRRVQQIPAGYLIELPGSTFDWIPLTALSPEEAAELSRIFAWRVMNFTPLSDDVENAGPDVTDQVSGAE